MAAAHRATQCQCLDAKIETPPCWDTIDPSSLLHVHVVLCGRHAEGQKIKHHHIAHVREHL